MPPTLGAYREAAAQYERALRFPAEDQRALAELYDGYADAARPRRPLARGRRGASAARSTLWHELGDARREGHDHRRLVVGDVAAVPRARVRRRHWSARSSCSSRSGDDPELARALLRPGLRRSGPTTPRPATRCSSAPADGRARSATRRCAATSSTTCAYGAFTARRGLGRHDGRGARDRAGGAGRGPGGPRLRQRLHVLQPPSSGSPRASGSGETASPTATSATSRRTPPACAATAPSALLDLGRWDEAARSGRARARHGGEPGQPADLAGHARSGAGPARAARRRSSCSTPAVEAADDLAEAEWIAFTRLARAEVHWLDGDDDAAVGRPRARPRRAHARSSTSSTPSSRLGDAACSVRRTPAPPPPEPWATWLAGDHAAAAARWDAARAAATTPPWRCTTPTATTTCARRSPASRRSGPTRPSGVPASG